MTEISIDPEFAELCPPLQQEEHAGLMESLICDGCREPLVIWQGLIIDGHNRFRICKDCHIPFTTYEMNLPDRDSVKLWIVENQLNRRNLDVWQKLALRETEGELLAQKAKINQGTRTDILMNSSKSGEIQKMTVDEPINTRKQIAKKVGVSEQTLDRMRKIKKKKPDLIKDIKEGKTSTNKVFNDIEKEEKLEARREELKQKTITIKELPISIQLYHGDFLTDYKKIPEESVDCIITDPPYVKEWLDNYAAFAEASAYVLKPGGFLISYVGHIHLDRILSDMTSYLDYFWIMTLIHSGTAKAVHSRSVQCGMKPILVMNKPPRTQPKRYFNDVIKGSGKEKDAHEWQQGEEELRQIFEPFTDPGDVVLDPFMGSGTVLSMAKKMNRRVMGWDINKENVDVVRGRLVV